jgi:hypothetical protein
MRLQQIHSLLRVSGTAAGVPVCQIFHSSCPVEVHPEDKFPSMFRMQGSSLASHFLGELSSDWINLDAAWFDFGFSVHGNLSLLQLWFRNCLVCSACYCADSGTYRHCTEIEYLLRGIKVKCIACKQYFPFSWLVSRRVGDCPFKRELQNIAAGSSARKKFCGNTCLLHLLLCSCIHMVVWMVLMLRWLCWYSTCFLVLGHCMAAWPAIFSWFLVCGWLLFVWVYVQGYTISALTMNPDGFSACWLANSIVIRYLHYAAVICGIYFS